MKKQAQAINRAFDQQLREVLRDRFAAVPNEGFLSNMYELSLETKVGTLLVQPNGYYVSMRFVDVDRAKALLPHSSGDVLNPFSGKYNSPYFDAEHSIQTRLDAVLYLIEEAT